ncbi:hypothetical protein BLS_000802 [Venturia inaequalis]|uniref:Glycosyl hydrolase family 43 protein n=1 Tax=Venturia inaequalis TaxID=5025 RepID=A0A8H3UYS7_VENIN|nr:hypothetical protein BLS_000802 [Venturia inaequalis]
MIVFGRLTALLPLISSASAALQILPGAAWTDQGVTGRHLQAHGPGVIKVADTYYMIGEDKLDGSSFQNVNCYASTNLVEWNFAGALLSRTASGELGPNRVVERPKVIYNESTKKYVLYMHVEDSGYKEAKVGVAVGDTVCGKYEYLGSYRPMDNQSRDMGLYQDDDGTGYLLSEDRPHGLHIYKLSSDYLKVESQTYMWPEKYESPAIVKRNGVYFMFASHLTGWQSNDNLYSTATSLSGPWSPWANFAPPGSKTFNSQTTYILPISKDLIVYMGDRWVDGNLMRSTYVWLPLKIEGKKATLTNQEHWSIDWDAGTWSPGPKQESYEAEKAKLSGGAKILNCSGCSGGKLAGYLGGPEKGAVTFENVLSDQTERKSVRIFAPNGDKTQRFAMVTVNEGQAVRIAILPSNAGSMPAVSVANLDFNAGANSVRIESLGDGSWGPDLDRLMVSR